MINGNVALPFLFDEKFEQYVMADATNTYFLIPNC